MVRNQSTFSTDPEVIQNCAVFTFCSSAGLAVSNCATVMGSNVVGTVLLCVVCIGLLSVEFSTVNTGLCRPMFLEPLYLLSTPATNYQLT